MNYGNALESLSPNSSWSWDGQDYEGISWHSENTDDIPTKEELDAEVTRLQEEYDSNDYARARALAYPQLAEQLDKLWHDINNGTLDETGDFFTALKTVKDDNPKPGE